MSTNAAINRTHARQAGSWVPSANAPDADFPIQNLPFASFRSDAGTPFRGGVAIGDQILDLAQLHEARLLGGMAAQALARASEPHLNGLMSLSPSHWQALRFGLFDILHTDASESVQRSVGAALRPMASAEFQVPTVVGDYTDFLSSYFHCRNCAPELESMEEGIPPQIHHMPMAYHGRSSSIVISGTGVRRPSGQIPLGAPGKSVLANSAKLDYECELGMFIGGGNAQGQPVPLSAAGAMNFGVCLLNDWSARDIQGWEMYPLGCFHSKNFATSISPWIVTTEALAPFRCAWTRDAAHPQPPAYLDSPGLRDNGGLDIRLEVLLTTQRTPHRVRLSSTTFRHTHWTLEQLIAQHTVNGCNLRPGDILGSGTVSGPTESESGAMIELSRGGKRPVDLGNGEQRAFLEDGDTVSLRGWCESPDFRRIGFGECQGTVLPAR